MNRLSAAFMTCLFALILMPSAGLAQSKQEGVRLYKEAFQIRKKAQTHSDLKQAVKKFEQALIIFEKVGFKKGISAAAVNLGHVYRNLGQYDKAVSYYEKSLVIRRDLKDRLGEGRTLCNLGKVYAHQGVSRKAREKILEGLTIWKDIKVPTKWPKNLLANLYLDEGDFDRAEPLVKEAGYSSTYGRLHLLKKGYEKAKGPYERLLQSAEKNRNADDLFTAFTGLGLTYEGIKDNEKAAEFFQKAVDFTEELRTSLTPAQREKFFDVKINGFIRTIPYEGLARVLMKMKKPNEAFKGSEYTKARVFAETISRQSKARQFDISEDIIKQDQDLANQLSALKQARQKAYEKQDKLAIEALEPQIKELANELKAHIKMLRNKYPLFAATKYPEPMNLSQTALKADEWVLSYDVTDTGVIVYLTKGKELVKGLFKPMARKELDGLVRKFREPLEITPSDSIGWKLASFDLKTGKRLADILLGDILTNLPRGVPIIIVQDDSLGVLPFEMLVLNKGGKVERDKRIPYVSGAQFFGDRNPISYYQSVTALTLARTFGKSKKAGTRRLVMDDPVFDSKDPRVMRAAHKEGGTLSERMIVKLMSIKTELGLTFPRLPLTGRMGKSVKDLDPAGTDEYTGLNATKNVLFKRPLGRYGSMVFATHGYFGKDLPGIQERVLVLTLVDQPKRKDGFLRMSEVMGLKMNADIVALTACQTGLGRRISGEGTMGMGRAFQYAGARSVLMSMWSVAQSSSVKLVESFFKHLKKGKSKLEALRLARKGIREAGYDHPFFWAPFILVGEVN